MTNESLAPYRGCMKWLVVAALVTVSALSTAACGGGSRAILYAGVTPGSSGHRIYISDATARADGTSDLARWKTSLRVDARRAPEERFHNLPPRTFLARLHSAAARYGFTITSVRFYKPRQLAPYVRVETRHYLRLAHAVAAIERAINPHGGTSDLGGWSYEGFYFQADDERGIPFIIASTLTRGQVAGSQWARSEQLYPGAHG